MRDAWQDLLGRLSGPHEDFGSGDVASWKRADFEALCDLGLVSDGQLAASILCPECSAHWAEVMWNQDGTRAFIVCTSEGLPINVDPERLRQWEPNKPRFAAELAAELGIPDPPLNLVIGRLWRLGRCSIANRQRDIFFAAVAPDDLQSAVIEIRRGYGSVAGVLLLPSAAPDPGQHSKLKVIDLSNASALRCGRIDVDLPFIEEQFTDGRRASSKGLRLKSPARDLKEQRMGILRAFAPSRDHKQMKDLARHLGVSPSALYGMVRDDRSRYSQDKLETVLSRIGCSRAKWDRSPKPASHA